MNVKNIFSLEHSKIIQLSNSSTSVVLGVTQAVIHAFAYAILI